MTKFTKFQSRVALAAGVLALGFATPALAQGSTAVPEPSDLALFALGVLGVLIGRRAAAKRPPDRD